MESAIRMRFCLAVALFTLAAVSMFAQDAISTIEPAPGVTLNGQHVMQATTLSVGDKVQTATEPALLAVAAAEIRLDPGTTIIFGDPLELRCGMITVLSGTVRVNHGGSVLRAPAGISVRPSPDQCASSLPQAPSAALEEPAPPAPVAHRQQRSRDVPAAGRGFGLGGDSGVADSKYWAVTGVMFSSSLVSAELTQNCLHAGNCRTVPDAFRSRAAMYGAGLPAATGVSYLSYYLKKKGKRWWFVPAALVTAGNVVVSTHAARYSR